MPLERRLKGTMDEEMFYDLIKDAYIHALNKEGVFLRSLDWTSEQLEKFQDRVQDIETRFSRLRAGRKNRTP